MHGGISYDVFRRGKDERGQVLGALYYDGAINLGGYGGADGESRAPRSLAYSGVGVAVRRYLRRDAYVGAGIGSYDSGIGGKVFAGIEARGAVFGEIAVTRVPRYTRPPLAVVLGVRL